MLLGGPRYKKTLWRHLMDDYVDGDGSGSGSGSGYGDGDSWEIVQ